MALKKQNIRFTLNLSLLLCTLATLLLNPISTLAMGNHAALPTFTDFSQAVQNGQADILRGVYVNNVLALPIIQQPTSNAGFVSRNDGEVTQFRMASKFGNVGLLAHNHLAGKNFSNLAVGQEVIMIYGDGSVEHFIVTEVLQYQAMQPYSPYSEFRDLSNDTKLTAEQMFKKVYFGDRHVTFQTCIEAEGNLSWGRLFVIAIPKEEYSKYDRLNP
jgi:hypothetical protein